MTKLTVFNVNKTNKAIKKCSTDKDKPECLVGKVNIVIFKIFVCILYITRIYLIFVLYINKLYGIAECIL